MDGKEWVRYDCTWRNELNGPTRATLYELMGLHSGKWEMIIKVDGKVIMSESVDVLGPVDGDYWAPAAPRTTCFDTTPTPWK
jgi:hypothetical protein